MTGSTPETNGTSCSCDGFRTSRRNFLGGAAAIAGAGLVTAVHGSAFMQTAYAATGSASNVLVVLSLRGGADGMSLVVPHGDPAYAKARKDIAVPKETLLQADSMFGLHPNFEPLSQMWTDKKFAAIHAVGLPQPNRSHFAAMEEIEDADPGSSARVGWLNRLIGLTELQGPLEAVNMGSAMMPTSLFGKQPALAIRELADMELAGPSDPDGMARRKSSLHAVWDGYAGSLGRGVKSALQVSDVFATNPPPPVDPPALGYPKGDLGTALAESAALIRADLGAQVITVDYGNWDMHAGLGTLEYGGMRSMVSELAKGLAAFFNDLGALADKVTVVTLSEFGRRVQVNDAKGLDHGYGNCMLLLGAGVKGGQYYGTWPGLDASKLVEGDLNITNDYRSVLAEVVDKRFGVSVSKVFPNFQPNPLGIMAA
jgi:uncharacterized protein (DUF1501 family)